MKNKKRFVALFLSLIVCFSLIALPASAAVQPRWSNADLITLAPIPSNDQYFVQVQGVDGTTKIEITATLQEKNFFGFYVDKDTTSDTFYSKTANLYGYYDMNPDKEYKVVATIYVTTNGYRELIEL